MKYDKKLLEATDDTIRCENCAFNENCEDHFDECVANYSKDETYTKACHLKYCELIHWNELSEDEKSNLEEAIAALKKVLNEIDIQKNYPIIKEEEIKP